MSQRPLAIGLLIALAGCSGGSATIPTVTASAASGAPVSAAALERIEPGASFSARTPLNSLGGIPSCSISLSLYDAPLSVQPGDQVNLAVLGVNLVKGSTVTPLFAFSSPRLVNVLDLVAQGVTFSGPARAQDYDSMQFVVVPADSSVVSGGTTYPVQIGSVAPTSTAPTPISVPIHVNGGNGATVQVTADFNALESVQIAGSVATITSYVVAAQDAATVTGHVLNRYGSPVVGAAVAAFDRSGKKVNTGLTQSDGSFAVHALAAGAYTLKVENIYTTATGSIVIAKGATSFWGASTTLSVSPGQTLDLGTLKD